MAANAQKNREILDQSAVTFEHLRKFAEAKKLREASLALAEQISGPQSAEYAMALVRLGDLARRYGTLQESNDYYKRALSMGDRPEVFPALMRLGLTSKDPEERRNYLERARVAARNGNDAGSAMTWLAQRAPGRTGRSAHRRRSVSRRHVARKPRFGSACVHAGTVRKIPDRDGPCQRSGTAARSGQDAAKIIGGCDQLEICAHNERGQSGWRCDRPELALQG